MTGFRKGQGLDYTAGELRALLAPLGGLEPDEMKAAVVLVIGSDNQTSVTAGPDIGTVQLGIILSEALMSITRDIVNGDTYEDRKARGEI